MAVLTLTASELEEALLVASAVVWAVEVAGTGVPETKVETGALVRPRVVKGAWVEGDGTPREAVTGQTVT